MLIRSPVDDGDSPQILETGCHLSECPRHGWMRCNDAIVQHHANSQPSLSGKDGLIDAPGDWEERGLREPRLRGKHRLHEKLDATDTGAQGSNDWNDVVLPLHSRQQSCERESTTGWPESI